MVDLKNHIWGTNLPFKRMSRKRTQNSSSVQVLKNEKPNKGRSSSHRCCFQHGGACVAAISKIGEINSDIDIGYTPARNFLYCHAAVAGLRSHHLKTYIPPISNNHMLLECLKDFQGPLLIDRIIRDSEHQEETLHRFRSLEIVCIQRLDNKVFPPFFWIIATFGPRSRTRVRLEIVGVCFEPCDFW